MFELHPVLEKNTFHVADLELCTILLSNNALYPWLILVPKKPDITEIIDLCEEDNILLMQEINLISQYLKHEFEPDKLNIAALGNQVPQLHIHIIGRYKDDQAWPSPVWEKGVVKYEDRILKMMMERLSGINKLNDIG